jgi:type II restriction enzyme
MTGELATAYHSGAQRARVVTESWGESNLYCPNCSSPKLTWLEPGHPASDYSCPKCGFWFQLKSQKSRIGDSITDGAYAAMMSAICHDKLPSFYFMQYELATWRVRNLLLVPHFAFPPSAIIKRPPLSRTARRAGWVGCNFALNRIPVEARIDLVTTVVSPSPPSPTGERGGVRWRKSNPLALSLSPLGRGEGNVFRTVIVPPEEVRARFRKVKPLKELSVKERGWTLDVLNAIRRLGKSEFTTTDAYIFERELEQLHPDNRNIKAKIRQQLQELRDRNLLLHVGRTCWRLP